MRREVKLGIFITLSVGLVVAVLAGKAVSRGSITTEERLALTADDASRPETTGLPVALETQSAGLRSALPGSGAGAVEEQPAFPSTNEEAIDQLLANLPESSRSLPAPSFAEEEMRRYFEAEEGTDAEATSAIAGIGKEEGAKERAEDSRLPVDANKELIELAESVGLERKAESARLRLPAPTASSIAESVPPSTAERKYDSVDEILLETAPGEPKLESRTETASSVLDKEAATDSLTRVEEAILGASPEGATIHIVRDKDTLWDIAVKYYGSGVQAKRIAAANPSVRAHNLRIGTKLVIPPKAEAKAEDARLRAGTEAAVDDGSGKNIYIVRGDDTLWDISYKFYGAGSEWKKIAKANPSLKTPGKLKPGTRLVIP